MVINSEMYEIASYHQREAVKLRTYESMVVQQIRGLGGELSWWLVRRLFDFGGTDYLPLRQISTEEAQWLVANCGVTDLYGDLGALS
jgi:hypothetical protein